MKKLIMVAMIAVGCGSAFGANIDWGVTRYAWGNQDPYTYTEFEGVGVRYGVVYAFLSSDMTAVQEILGAATSGADVDFSTIAVKEASTFTSGKGAAAGTLVGSDEVLAAGSKYDVFFVAFNNTSLESSDKYLVSNTIQGTAYASTAPSIGVEATWDNTSATTGVTTSWQTFSIPEPTSGLLLLLGVAGLALKRRRA